MLSKRRTPRSTRTDTLFPYTTPSDRIEHPYDLTGLYEGRPLTERSIGESGGMPDRVTLYRIPILVEWIEADGDAIERHPVGHPRSEEHTSELQSLMRISYAVFCLKHKTKH